MNLANDIHKFIAYIFNTWSLSQIFSGTLNMPSPTDNKKQFGEHDAHIPKRCGGGFWLFGGL